MSDSLFDVVQLNPKGGNVSIEMLLTIAGVFISIASAFWAYLSAKAGQESLKLMRAEEELARPCIGESFWEVDFENEIAFCKLRFFPGRHFVQTKAIIVPGYKLSSVRQMNYGGRAVRLSNGENVESLSCGLSLPVNASTIEVELAIAPIPRTQFEIIVELQRNEKSITYVVQETLLQGK